MVPSDPSGSSSSGRHARPGHGIRNRCDVGPPLPATGFGRLRITARVRVPSPNSGRSLPLDAAFHSPDPTASLATRRRERLKRSRPASSKQSSVQTGPVRRIHSRLRASFCCSAKDVRREAPVARFSLKTHRSSPGLHSPPGPLDPSGSTWQTRLRPAKLTLAVGPIFLYSPQRGNDDSSQRAADPRYGFAASRQARCPSNLLEPRLECTETRPQSSKNGFFPQI